jgi:hypothetical protein
MLTSWSMNARLRSETNVFDRLNSWDKVMTFLCIWDMLINEFFQIHPTFYLKIAQFWVSKLSLYPRT